MSGSDTALRLWVARSHIVLTSIDEIEEWLLYGSPQEAIVYIEGRANESFLIVFALLVLRFREPDFPGNPLLRKRLGLSSGLLAIWEFDYSRIALLIETIGEEQTVILTRYTK